MEWGRQFLLWHRTCKYTDEGAAVSRQPEFTLNWRSASSGCCVSNLILQLRAGLVVLLGSSFASEGTISSNKLCNFTASSRACLQLSSSRRSLATRQNGATPLPPPPKGFPFLQEHLPNRAQAVHVTLLVFALSWHSHSYWLQKIWMPS